MKVRLLRECPTKNPLFDPAAKVEAEAKGEIYDVPHTIMHPAGTEIEHPQAHYLCHSGYMNTPPAAEPIDEPAKRKHAVYLERKKALLEQLRAMLKNPPKDKKAREHLLQTARAYGLVGREEASTK